MCGRYTLKTTSDVVAEYFETQEYPSSLTPGYDVAPTQEVAAVVEENGKRKLETFRWGLIPFWAKGPAMGNRMINARAETVSEKPSFRQHLQEEEVPHRRRRVLRVAEGG